MFLLLNGSTSFTSCLITTDLLLPLLTDWLLALLFAVFLLKRPPPLDAFLINLCAETISPVASSNMPIGVGPSELIICFNSVTDSTSEPEEEEPDEQEISARFGIICVLLVENIYFCPDSGDLFLCGCSCLSIL